MSHLFAVIALAAHAGVKWLQEPAFTLWNYTPSRSEFFGFLTGGWGDVFLVKKMIITWPIGIINNVMLFLTFITVGLYADAGLQMVYIGLASWGWYNWSRIEIIAKSRMSAVNRRDLKFLLYALCLGFPLIFVLEFSKTHTLVALWDALTTMISLLGIWCQAKKKWQAWIIWCVVDCIYVPLYAYKQLYLQAILYIGFVLITIIGMINWRREYLQTMELEDDIEFSAR